MFRKPLAGRRMHLSRRAQISLLRCIVDLKLTRGRPRRPSVIAQLLFVVSGFNKCNRVNAWGESAKKGSRVGSTSSAFSSHNKSSLRLMVEFCPQEFAGASQKNSYRRDFGFLTHSRDFSDDEPSVRCGLYYWMRQCEKTISIVR